MMICTGMRCPMQFGFDTNRCTANDCPYRTEPMTNADKIRAMTDEELAAWLAQKFTNHETEARMQRGEIPSAILIHSTAEQWYSAWMQWLRQPAEDSDG